MKHACIFKENYPLVLVSAEDIKNGLYSREEEFVDPEYEFKVQYVKGAKNNGGPYFRLYYSFILYNYEYIFDCYSFNRIVKNISYFLRYIYIKKYIKL